MSQKKSSMTARAVTLHPIALLILTLGAQQAGAQTAPEAVLPEVVVTAKAPMNQPSNTLTPAMSAAKTATTSDSAQLLRGIAGVSLNQAGGVSSLPAIRGLADDRLRIKVNGIDFISACANHMNPALSYIDPTHVGSVKVYMGAAPVSVGGDSIGGSIVVESAEPLFASAGQSVLRTGEVGGFYRSNGNAMGAHATATLATEKVSLKYSGSTAESKNYTAAKDFKADFLATGTTEGSHTIKGDEVGSSAYKTQNHELNTAFKSGNHVLDAKFGYQNVSYQGFPNQHMDMTGNESTQINLGYKGAFDWGKLSARYYNEHTAHSMNFYKDKLFWYGPAGNVPGMPMDTSARNIGGLVKAEVALSDNQMVQVGSEYQKYRLNDYWSPSGGGMAPNTFWNINDGKRNRLALFGELTSNWSEQWATLAGLRYERVTSNTGTVQGYNTTMANYLADSTAFNATNRKRTDNNIDFSIVTRYTPTDNQNYELALARKTRSPSLYERYTWSTGGMALAMNDWVNDGNGYKGNLDLKPEVAYTLGFTANMRYAGWGIKVAPHYTKVNNYIDATCLKTCTAGQFNALTLVNQDARLYGVDVSGDVALGKVASIGAFTAKANISYLKGKNTETDDNLYNIMPLNGQLSLEHQRGNWRNALEWQLVSKKNHVSQVRGENQTAGYGLLHLRSSYAWHNLTIDAGVENLLNKAYAQPLGGAYIGQGRTMSLNGAGAPYGVQVPGMGRSYYAGVKLKF